MSAVIFNAQRPFCCEWVNREDASVGYIDEEEQRNGGHIYRSFNEENSLQPAYPSYTNFLVPSAILFRSASRLSPECRNMYENNEITKVGSEVAFP